MKYNLAIIGLGNVGTGLIEVLIQKKESIKTSHYIDIEVVAVCDKIRGSIYNADGLDLNLIAELANSKRSLDEYPDAQHGMDSIQSITDTNANVVIELTITNLKTAEPAITHVRTALSHGKHVITSNKGPSSLYHNELRKLAHDNHVQYRIEGTVMSGTPVLRTAQYGLAGCTIHKIRGILNGTSNYILTKMEKGAEYDAAIKDAIRHGYAEADPSGDVEGWDALAKVVILSNVLLDGNISNADVRKEGITELKHTDIKHALSEGYRWKLIGEIEKRDGQIIASVSPQKLPLSDPLANVMGSTNAITFETDILGPVTIIGAGAGRIETGYSIISDLLTLHQIQTSR
ncbi:homoserine dehydrogenase [candidate division KSB1 bacterium]|nr:homoserine dehydrogenase [candidate division KSB1 bacterium]